MSRLKPENMRPIEVMVARAICQAHKEFRWRYLKDVDGNPSTAYAFYDYLRMGRAAVKEIEKRYAGGAIGEVIARNRRKP